MTRPGFTRQDSAASMLGPRFDNIRLCASNSLAVRAGRTAGNRPPRNSEMKLTFPRTILLLLGVPFFSGCAYPFREKIAENQSSPAAGLRQIDLSTRNGTIEIVADPGCKDVSIAATKSARGASPADARDAAE